MFFHAVIGPVPVGLVVQLVVDHAAAPSQNNSFEGEPMRNISGSEVADVVLAPVTTHQKNAGTDNLPSDPIKYFDSALLDRALTT